MIDFVELRRGMVDSQVRTNDVTDLRIVAAMLEIPRERFVPAPLKPLAYIDDDLLVRPAAGAVSARYMLEPMMLAKLVQLADIAADELVLDIGSGTGYSSAVMASLAGQVVSLEDDADLIAQAGAAFAELGLANVASVKGPLTAGWAAEAPYDVIFLNGSVDKVPPALFAQLKDGGRLVAVVGRGGAGRAALFTKSGDAVSERDVFNSAIPVLSGFEAKPHFTF